MPKAAPNTPETTARSLSFEVFGNGIQVFYDTDYLAELLRACYGAFEAPIQTAQLSYRITTRHDGSGYHINSYQLDLPPPQSDSELIYAFEKDIELGLQHHHADWYFIHGAAAAFKDRIGIFMAASGSGKSTLTWASLTHGFSYMSDELAPVEPNTLTVQAYPHALCLKTRPPSPYGLPDTVFQTQRTLHVPVHSLPGEYRLTAGKVSALFFVRYDPTASAPSLSPVTQGQAAAQLYANGLNQLAHDNKGLATAAMLAGQIDSYQVTTTANLARSVEQVKQVLLNEHAACSA